MRKSYKKTRLICGVGVNDADYATQPRVDGKKVCCQYYQTWRNMLMRCYCAKYQAGRPTYTGCTVCDEWHSFMAFRSWMQTQDWNYKQLDKDVLSPDNKVYSPETCLFVTPQINLLLNTRAAARGDLLLGVCRNGKRFVAQISVNGNRQYLGLFDTPAEASAAFNAAKAANIRSVAYEQSDPRIKSALLRHAKLFGQGEMQ